MTTFAKNQFDKGCQIIRDAKFLEEIWYIHLLITHLTAILEDSFTAAFLDIYDLLESSLVLYRTVVRYSMHCGHCSQQDNDNCKMVCHTSYVCELGFC